MIPSAHQKLVIFVIVLRSAKSRTNSEKILKRGHRVA